MANAFVQVQVPPPAPPPTLKVKLELSVREALVLQSVLANIGGSQEDSPRGITNDVLSALRSVTHIGWVEKRSGSTYDPIGHGSIYFDEYDLVRLNETAAEIESLLLKERAR